MRPALLLLLASALSACSLFERSPEYSGPSDYAYTLTVSCFCAPLGPLRITVLDNEVVEVRQLDPKDSDLVESIVQAEGRTLDELSALVDRARREADELMVEYDPTYGFPTDVSIDWEKDAVDDEVGYTVRDFEVL